MAIAGLRGTGDWGTDERPKNFRDLILWQNPNGKAPLFALTSKLKKSPTDDPEFSWWEEISGVIRLQLDGAIANTADVTWTVDNSTASNAAVDANGRRGNAYDLVPGDLLLVETSTGVGAAHNAEVVMVDTVTSATAFTVLRNQAGTSGGDAIATDTFLTKIGNAYEEGSTSPNTSTRNPRKFVNYVQIFKTAYQMTETAKATTVRTGNGLKNDKKRKSFDHSAAIEMALLLGHASETTGAGGKLLRTTGGLLEHLVTAGRAQIATAYPASAAGADAFFDDVYDCFDYDGGGAGDERLVFCGNGALNVLNKAARAAGQVEFMETVKVYGMNLTKWVIPQGTLYFKSHPLLNQHPQFTNSMFVVEPTGIRYRPLRDTIPQDNIQAPDADYEKGQWLTEAGFEFNYMECMKYLGNVRQS